MAFDEFLVVVCVQSELQFGWQHFGREEAPANEGSWRTWEVHEEATAGPAQRRGIGPAVYAAQPSGEEVRQRSDWMGLGDVARSVVHQLSHHMTAASIPRPPTQTPRNPEPSISHQSVLVVLVGVKGWAGSRWILPDEAPAIVPMIAADIVLSTMTCGRSSRIAIRVAP